MLETRGFFNGANSTVNYKLYKSLRNHKPIKIFWDWMINWLSTSVRNTFNYVVTRVAYKNEQGDGRINEHTTGKETIYTHFAPTPTMQDFFSPSDPQHWRLMKYLARDSGRRISVSANRCWHGRPSHLMVNWSHKLAPVTLTNHSVLVQPPKNRT